MPRKLYIGLFNARCHDAWIAQQRPVKLEVDRATAIAIGAECLPGPGRVSRLIDLVTGSDVPVVVVAGAGYIFRLITEPVKELDNAKV